LQLGAIVTLAKSFLAVIPRVKERNSKESANEGKVHDIAIFGMSAKGEEKVSVRKG